MGYDTMSDRKEILKIENLQKQYKNANNLVLNGIDLTIHEEDFLCVLGPSGCGKSTMIRCIAGFEDYQGTIEVSGKTVKGPGTDRIMVFQDFNQLFPWMTVEKNIQYPLKLQGIHKKNELKNISKEVLNKVKLSNYEQYYPYQLSGGMKQRVAIAKALALKPKIILMDEPFAALDAITRSKLQEELLTISAEEKCTIIFITHNIQEAIILGTRIIVLEKGGKILIDEQNLIDRPVTPASEGYGAVWKRLHNALYQEVKF